MSHRTASRRRFLESTTLTSLAAMSAAAAPTIVPASALGAEGQTPPSRRIVVGMIGLGRQAQLVNMRQFLGMADVQLVRVSA